MAGRWKGWGSTATGLRELGLSPNERAPGYPKPPKMTLAAIGFEPSSSRSFERDSKRRRSALRVNAAPLHFSELYRNDEVRSSGENCNRRRWRTTGAAKRIELGNVRPNHLLKLISASTAALGRQSRSNQVSGRCLPKTGVFADSGGDFCRNGMRVCQFGSSETGAELQKPAKRVFLPFEGWRVRPRDWLPGVRGFELAHSRSNPVSG
jgi:hypothetical protein